MLSGRDTSHPWNLAHGSASSTPVLQNPCEIGWAGGARGALRWSNYSYTGLVQNKSSPDPSRWAVLWKGRAVERQSCFPSLQPPAVVSAMRVPVFGTGWEWGAAPSSPVPQFMGPMCSGEKPSAHSDIQPQLCSCCWRWCWLVHNVGE